MYCLFDIDYEPPALLIKLSDLMAATADGADAKIDGSALDVLRLLREKTQISLRFVSEFVVGQRLFRGDDSGLLEPAVIATGDGNPVKAFHVDDLKRLQHIAQLAAGEINRHRCALSWA